MRFVVVPFRSNPQQPQLEGVVLRNQSTLSITFESINSDVLCWPDTSSAPDRLDNLWQSTCFECFIGCSDTNAYLEVNASPSGDWQTYHFSGYRADGQLSIHDSAKVTSEQTSDTKHAISIEVDIGHPQFVTKRWQISICAILADRNTKMSYYAIEHPGSQPDFHLSELRQLMLN